MQPSDLRIKRVLKEVDPKEQLENVKKIKIVQYKYRPEFVSQLPQEERHQLQRVPHTGIIGKKNLLVQNFTTRWQSPKSQLICMIPNPSGTLINGALEGSGH